MNVAVIPSRGGSKRIPRKNIKKFCGKPMISWPIGVIKQSKLFDRIIVSTDDDQIAKIARSYGAETPFMRPAELADDYSGTIEVIAHAISWMYEQKWKPDAVCCIYPTSVFLTIDDLERGLKAFNSGNWKYAFSVTNFEYPIFRSLKKSTDGGVEMVFPEYFETRSQDFPETLHDAAQFYWGKPTAWLNHDKLFGRNSIPVMIPRWRVEDIDTEDDWIQAEKIFHNEIKKLHGEQKK
ncbi:MAG: pseudaminic acid cytidylyltransferase [Candidatus Marinimicrobia bacterium]|nr:pseudaminic acid cytidylyltransferase [Candidatus Neomarinimicrobiota bacterium]